MNSLTARPHSEAMTRRGPGAGRPSKIYRRSPRQFAVMLPARRYLDAAHLFATAVEAAGPKATRALHRAAVAFGRQMGIAARELAGPKAGHERLLTAAEQVLRAYGFEPVSFDNYKKYMK